MNAYLMLAVAIVSEVIATTSLKASDGFTRWLPAGAVIVGYAVSFYLLGMVVRLLPVGMVYAVWAGSGIVLVTLAGILFYRQVPDIAALIGITLIVVGVVTLQGFSRMGAH